MGPRLSVLLSVLCHSPPPARNSRQLRLCSDLTGGENLSHHVKRCVKKATLVADNMILASSFSVYPIEPQGRVHNTAHHLAICGLLDGETMVAVCEFDKLLSISVLHIHEKIFLSLDYQSYKNCQDVCKSWKDLLTSQFFQIRSKSVYSEMIQSDLLQAVSLGNVNEIKRTLSIFMVDLNFESRHFQSPLHLAAKRGYKEVVRLLLDRGAEPNRRSYSGGTPLKWAAWYGHKDVVQLLMERGATPKIADCGGHTPLHYAAQDGRKHIVKLLLDEAADPNAQDNLGLTSLHVAAFMGHKEVVQILLDWGANPNMTNYLGGSPLFYARTRKHMEMAEILEGRRKSLPQQTRNP